MKFLYNSVANLCVLCASVWDNVAKIRSVFLFLFVSSSLSASPTSLFWTNCSTDVQPIGTANVNIDTYYPYLPPLVGPLFGVLDFHGLQGELGVDCLVGTASPLYFNGKVGMKEGHYVPSWSLGVFNCGTSRKTNQNVVDFVTGKTVPGIGGQLYVGVYSGSKAMQGTRQGFMIGYKRTFMSVDGRYDRWGFIADYASGKNTIGGGGLCVQYFFSPVINLQAGPVWFHSRTVSGNCRWTLQLNVGFS